MLYARQQKRPNGDATFKYKTKLYRKEKLRRPRKHNDTCGGQ